MRIRPYELFQGNVLIGYRNIICDAESSDLSCLSPDCGPV